MAKDTFKRVQGLVNDQLGIEMEKIVPSASFTADLGADSLDIVELVMSFEEEFEIEIDDTSASNIETVEQVVAFIDNLPPSEEEDT